MRQWGMTRLDPQVSNWRSKWTWLISPTHTTSINVYQTSPTAKASEVSVACAPKSSATLSWWPQIGGPTRDVLQQLWQAPCDRWRSHCLAPFDFSPLCHCACATCGHSLSTALAVQQQCRGSTSLQDVMTYTWWKGNLPCNIHLGCCEKPLSKISPAKRIWEYLRCVFRLHVLIGLHLKIPDIKTAVWHDLTAIMATQFLLDHSSPHHGKLKRPCCYLETSHWFMDSRYPLMENTVYIITIINQWKTFSEPCCFTEKLFVPTRFAKLQRCSCDYIFCTSTTCSACQPT